MKKTGKLLIEAAAIFVAGVVVGMLYAPRKGKHTRRSIARKSKWFLHSAKGAIEVANDNMQALKDKIKES